MRKLVNEEVKSLHNCVNCTPGNMLMYKAMFVLHKNLAIENMNWLHISLLKK